MSQRIFTVLFYVLLLLLILLPVIAIAEEAVPCRREGERVSCTADGFKTLTGSCLQAKADAHVFALKLADANKEVAARESAMQACEAALAAVPPPRSALMPVVGYAVSVVSTVLLVSTFVAPLTDTGKLAVGGLGLAGLVGGVVLVLP